MNAWSGRIRRLAAAGAVGAVAVVAVACGSSPTALDYEVIEETTFAPSLGVDLATMTRTNTGVYWKNLVTGSGDPAVFGTTPFVTYTLWLTDGTEVESGSFGFLMGNNRVISGFEDGLLNTRAGGSRQMIIPPNRGYGGADQLDSLGNVTIPGGSVLVFEVTVDSVRS